MIYNIKGLNVSQAGIKRIILPTILLVIVVVLLISAIAYRRTPNYANASFSRNMYCGLFKFVDKNCDLNDNWVAKDYKTGDFVIVQGNKNTAILDTVGARTVLEFSRDSSGSFPITCLPGPEGAEGADGAAGATGSPGSAGSDGSAGAQGPQGEKGDTGATGATGATGSQGAQGDKGDTGATGAQGDKGDTGATGAAGVCTQGDTGPQGPPGPQGDIGATGSQGIQGIQGIQGPPGTSGMASAYYGSFYDIQDQLITTPSVGKPVLVRNTDATITNGFSVVGGSRITAANSGKYNVAFSFQLHNRGGGGSGTTAEIWFVKNGVQLPDSNTRIAVNTNSPYVVAAWNYFMPLNAGEYVEIYWATDNANIVLEYNTGAMGGPAIPSAIITVNQVGI